VDSPPLRVFDVWTVVQKSILAIENTKEEDVKALSVIADENSVALRLPEVVESFNLLNEHEKEFFHTLFDTLIQVHTDTSKQAEDEIIHMLDKATLDVKQLTRLVSIFNDDSFSESLLNDVLNPHPIAAKLWSDRIAALTSTESWVEYTKTFHEGKVSLFKPFDEIPKLSNWGKQQFFMFNPAYTEFNTGLEEILHWKLQRLAGQYYGLDLTVMLDQTRFNEFLHTYEVSPGEDTLDRVHVCPPPHHTYEELPIIKFEGYEESDDPQHHGWGDKQGHSHAPVQKHH